MKRIIGITLRLLGVILVAILGIAAYVQIKGIPTYKPIIPTDFKADATPQRVEHGLKSVTLACYDCHVSKEENQLSGKFIADMPKEFGVVYSKNITKHPDKGIGKWTDGEIAYFLRTGVRKDGTYAPPYMPKFPLMSDEDIRSVIAFLRSDHVFVQPSERQPPLTQPSFLTKMLATFIFKPYPFDLAPAVTPTPSDEKVYGKYLADAVYGCTNCHSKDFKSNNELVPPKNVGYGAGGNPMPDLEGNIINSANITPDKQTGIGDWTAEEFIAEVKHGKGKDGQPLRYPMAPKAAMDSNEIKAIFSYLKTIPAINNPVDRNLKKAGL